MVSRAEAIEQWLMKSWSSDFFQALQRRLPLIVLSSLALVLASFSGTVSTPAVAWATGAGVAFMLAFLESFVVQIVRGAATKASAIAAVYGLTIIGFLCLFVVVGEFARVSWPGGVAYRFATRYGLTLVLMVLFLVSVVPQAIAVFDRGRKNTRTLAGTGLHRILAVGILTAGAAGSSIMIVSSIADIVLGGSDPSFDVLAWQTSALALVAISVLLGELAGKRWRQE